MGSCRWTLAKCKCSSSRDTTVVSKKKYWRSCRSKSACSLMCCSKAAKRSPSCFSHFRRDLSRFLKFCSYRCCPCRGLARARSLRTGLCPARSRPHQSNQLAGSRICLNRRLGLQWGSLPHVKAHNVPRRVQVWAQLEK